jgi:hypothetical protein
VNARSPRPFPFNGDPQEPKEAEYTIWRNNLAQEQRVVVHEGDVRIMYRVPPHGEKRIPSRHDMSIQRIQCAEDECRALGGFCRKGHTGTIHGGLAPQLVRLGIEGHLRPEGDRDHLALGLDTEAEAKLLAEMAVAASQETQQRAEIASLVAQNRADALAAKAAALAPGAPPPGSSAAKRESISRDAKG